MSTPERKNSTPAGSLRSSIGNLGYDVITLCELQAQLLQVDLREWVQRCVSSTLILGLMGLVLAVASVPLALLGAAHLLVNHGGLTMGAALLIVSGAGLVAAGICAYAAWRVVCRNKGSFSRFNEELAHNVHWVKQTLSNSSTTPDSTS